MKHFKYMTVTRETAVCGRDHITTEELGIKFLEARQHGINYTDHEIMDLIEKKHTAIEYAESMGYELFFDEEWIELPALSVTNDISRFALVTNFKHRDGITTLIFSDVKFIHEDLIAFESEEKDGSYFLGDWEDENNDIRRETGSAESKEEGVSEEATETVVE